MSRLPAVSRDDLAPEAQAIWDSINAVRPGVRGPYGVLMHVPALAGRVAALEDYFRFEAELDEADRELVILATVGELGARYPWARHEHRAHAAGTRREAIEAARGNGPEDMLASRERLLLDIPRALLRERTISDDLYARAEAELGQRQLVEAVALSGHYSLISHVVNAFDVPPPDDVPNI